MTAHFQRAKKTLAYRILSAFVAFTFSFSYIVPPVYAQGLPTAVMNLPIPGASVSLTAGFVPPRIIGMTIHADNPLMFDFMVDPGDAKLSNHQLQDESLKLIKYFLASLTVPAEKLWVNLSPYEKDKIVPKEFGQTEMGAELLAQDYMLKQLTASLMNPEDELGKKFWDRVYAKAQKMFGTSEIPLNTFNKIWIVPEKAVVYAHGLNAFVIESRLKVMMEEDYLALQHHGAESPNAKSDVVSGVSSSVIKEVLLPEIEKEVNEGKIFANLRQIYHSLILATWYKQNLKESLLGQIYVDKGKTGGLTVQDEETSQKIYNRYIEAFQKGVHNFIKEDYDPVTKQIIPRKYFSGGLNVTNVPISASSSPVALQVFASTVDPLVVTSGVQSPGGDVSYRMSFPTIAPPTKSASSPVTEGWKNTEEWVWGGYLRDAERQVGNKLTISSREYGSTVSLQYDPYYENDPYITSGIASIAGQGPYNGSHIQKMVTIDKTTDLYPSYQFVQEYYVSPEFFKIIKEKLKTTKIDITSRSASRTAVEMGVRRLVVFKQSASSPIMVDGQRAKEAFTAAGFSPDLVSMISPTLLIGDQVRQYFQDRGNTSKEESSIKYIVTSLQNNKNIHEIRVAGEEAPRLQRIKGEYTIVISQDNAAVESRSALGVGTMLGIYKDKELIGSIFFLNGPILTVAVTDGKQIAHYAYDGKQFVTRSDVPIDLKAPTGKDSPAALGGVYTEWPALFQNYYTDNGAGIPGSAEAVLKTRYSGALGEDGVVNGANGANLYEILVNNGFMTEIVTLEQAKILSLFAEGAGGAAFVMTQKGPTVARDIQGPMSNVQVYLGNKAAVGKLSAYFEKGKADFTPLVQRKQFSPTYKAPQIEGQSKVADPFHKVRVEDFLQSNAPQTDKKSDIIGAITAIANAASKVGPLYVAGARPTGQIDSGGAKQLAIDELTDQLFMDALRPWAKEYYSEDLGYVADFNGGGAKLSAMIDALDGSSKVKGNGSGGTIVTLRDQGTKAILASMIIVYGIVPKLIVAIEKMGAFEFVLENGSFFGSRQIDLSKEKVKEKGIRVALGGERSTWPVGSAKLVDKWTKEGVIPGYSGALVTDIFGIINHMMDGGHAIFSYLANKLRVKSELHAIAYILKVAGGANLTYTHKDGKVATQITDLLEVELTPEPDPEHQQKAPSAFGDEQMINEIKSAIAPFSPLPGQASSPVTFEEAVATPRTPIAAFNLKGEDINISQWLEDVAADYQANPDNRQPVWVAPAHEDLFEAKQTIDLLVSSGSVPAGHIVLGAQDVRLQPAGAYTGHPPSLDKLKQLGVKFVILGHSELSTTVRGEPSLVQPNKLIGQKYDMVVNDGTLIPIVAIGETAQENRDGKTGEVLSEQLSVRLGTKSPQEILKAGTIIANEPVWAIGEDRVRDATPADADTAAAWTRQWLYDYKGPEVAAYTRIQFGGSVSAENIAEINRSWNVDGALVGSKSKSWKTAQPIHKEFERSASSPVGGEIVQSTRVAINGFGQIGKDFLRAELQSLDDHVIVAANDLRFKIGTPEAEEAVKKQVSILQMDFDTKPGSQLKGVKAEYETDGENYWLILTNRDGKPLNNGVKIKLTSIPNVEQLPWRELGVDTVIESTGKFVTDTSAALHLQAGAKKVIISQPGKGKAIKSITPGATGSVEDFLAKETTIYDCASCTTNSLSAVVGKLLETVGIKNYSLNTVHAKTQSQPALDYGIHIAATGAAKALQKLYPQLEGKGSGKAQRVDHINGSLSIFTFISSRPTTKDEINSIMREAAGGPLKGILRYRDSGAVKSQAILGTDESGIFQADETEVNGDLVTIYVWYDNEFGYANRLVDLVTLINASGQREDNDGIQKRKRPTSIKAIVDEMRKNLLEEASRAGETSASSPLQEGRASSPLTYPEAGNVQEMLVQTEGDGRTYRITATGVEVFDQNAFLRNSLPPLVQEATVSLNQDVKEAARRVLREAGVTFGYKESSIHDIYMARNYLALATDLSTLPDAERARIESLTSEEIDKLTHMTIPAINVRTGVSAFDTMVQVFEVANEKKIGALIFELALSEKEYTDQPQDEYVAIVYAAAMATGYEGRLLFIQGDHYQTDAGYLKETDLVKRAEKKKAAINKIKKEIKLSLVAGKRQVDVDPSTLVNQEAFLEILRLEREMVTRYINARIAVDAAFKAEVERLGGINQENSVKAARGESNGIKALRRKLTDDLEVGLSIKEYSESLTDQEKQYIREFGPSAEELGRLEELYVAMHTETVEVTKEYIKYIRGLEQELGIQRPVLIGVEERHIDNKDHADFPTTVLGSIKLMGNILGWTKENSIIPPAKLALQTGAMHGLGAGVDGEVDWGIFIRHHLGRKAIGLDVFVQHGTSTIPKDQFRMMPEVGTGEAHLATEYQKITYDIVVDRSPAILSLMYRATKALVSPQLGEEQLEPDIVTRLERTKHLDANVRKKISDKGEVGLKWPAIFETKKAEGLTEEEIFKGLAKDGLGGKYTYVNAKGEQKTDNVKGSMKDLIKLNTQFIKRDLLVLPQEIKNEINMTLRNEFETILTAMNVADTQGLVEKLMPRNEYPLTLGPRPESLAASSPIQGRASSPVKMPENIAEFAATVVVKGVLDIKAYDDDSTLSLSVLDKGRYDREILPFLGAVQSRHSNPDMREFAYLLILMALNSHEQKREIVTEAPIDLVMAIRKMLGSSPVVDKADNPPGGIDLNPGNMDLETNYDGERIHLPMPEMPLENIKIDGLVPVIIHVTPVVNLPLLLGLADQPAADDAAGFQPQQSPVDTPRRFKARDIKEVGLLN